MRIAVGGFSHETNTYATACSGPTPLEAFRVHRGEEIVATYGGTGSYLGGILDAVDDLGGSAVPALHAIAEPSGTIAASAYGRLRSELLDHLERCLPVDGVALELHGAAVAEGVDDVEADLGRAVRSLVGPSVPVVAVLDLHANVTPALVEVLDLVVGVRHYPHTDQYERGRAVVDALPGLMAGRVRATAHLVPLPMLIPTTPSAVEPAAGAGRVCAGVEQDERVIACTFFHGFSGADVPFAGSSVLVTADADPALARRSAEEIAGWVWEHREGFRPHLCPAEDAVRRALAAPEGPVVVADTADNPGGGAPGDGTHLLRAMLDAGSDAACLGTVYDPETVAAAQRAGVGQWIDVALGGRHDGLHGAPVRGPAYVKALTDGRFRIRNPMGAGLPVDIGPTARLGLDGVDVLVASGRAQTLDAEVFLLHGIDVRRYRVVGVKSSVHFRAGFEGIAREVLVADSPGLNSRDVAAFARTRLDGPRWPLDPSTPSPIPSPGGGGRDRSRQEDP